MVTTILTGSRPELLSMTLESTLGAFPYLRHNLIALANGNDQATVNVLNKYKIKYLMTAKILGIGPALSRLADHAYKSKEKYWLSLEDDWFVYDKGLEKAVEILDNNPGITQVRLRHITDEVLKTHMIKGHKLEWSKKDGFLYAKAHMTFNPHLMRTADIPKAFPCTGERNAQKRWINNGYVAQLLPGIWKHIGDKQSLRDITKCEV